MSKPHPILTLWALILILLVTGGLISRAHASQGYTPRVQLAILLDTSGSMDGLIDQTRNQLWQVVNEFTSAQQNGVTPVLEVALYEYGNDNNSSDSGFVRRLSGFTGELDQISQGLFALTTNGGKEYCGFAIQAALDDLQWSNVNSDIKTIFIAGNEPFTQGPVDYRAAVNQALRMGITINTIHAGGYDAGVMEGWQSGGVLAGGDYMSIDHNVQVVHIEAPQDERISQLNQQLNSTYVPYGADGAAKLEVQAEQDQQSSEISSGLMSQRARTKASSLYDNSNWDLVDAYRQGKIDAEELAEYEAAEQLPASLDSLDTAQQLQLLDEKSAERTRIQQEINRLSREREAFIAMNQAETEDGPANMGEALIASIRKQAETKGFEFAD